MIETLGPKGKGEWMKLIEHPGGVKYPAYHQGAGLVAEVVDEHPGGVVHPAHDQQTGQVAGVFAEDPGDVAHLAYH